MNNKPVAWMPIQSKHTRIVEAKPDDEQNWIPLYTHPHPDNLGLAESIIKQQELQIEVLKAKLNKYHLKEDLDRNLDLIYGKEFIK